MFCFNHFFKHARVLVFHISAHVIHSITNLSSTHVVNVNIRENYTNMGFECRGVMDLSRQNTSDCHTMVRAYINGSSPHSNPINDEDAPKSCHLT